MGRARGRISVAAQVVGPQCVDGDEHDTGPRRAVARRTVRARQAETSRSVARRRDARIGRGAVYQVAGPRAITPRVVSVGRTPRDSRRRRTATAARASVPA